MSARTMNFDGPRSSRVRKLTMYTLATAGVKIARKLGESKEGLYRLSRELEKMKKLEKR